MAANISAGKFKSQGMYRLPWYLESVSHGLTGEALEKAADAFVARMGLGRM